MKDRPKKFRKKRSYIKIAGIIALLLVIIGAALWWFLLRSEPKNEPVERQDTTVVQEPTDPYTNRIRLIAGGDIVAHDSVNENAKQPDGSYNYMSMMDSFTPIFEASDMRFCNQVTPAGGTKFGITGYPEFNAPTELVRDLGDLGCNVVNMASNHSFDYSQEAINANVAAWESVPEVLAAVGQNKSASERDKVHVFEVKGVKIAFLAYTTYINSSAPATNDYGVNSYSRDFANKQISAAKEQGAEIIIASMRWGTEYSPAVDGAQKAEAAYLSGLGVDVILGHGPHVLQPVETITQSDGSETLVWYSLGNFLNSQLEAEALFNGLAVIDFDTQTKKVTNVGFLPIYMHYEWSELDAKNENLLARQNLELMLLEDATDLLVADQQLKTTVQAQRSRVQDTVNSLMAVEMLTKESFIE